MSPRSGPGAEHYFSTRPGAPSRRQSVPLVLPDLQLELATDRGVFSPDRIDPGTKALLLEGPPVDDPTGDLVDLGAGYGPIAIALAKRAPRATVWAVEPNERARELCAVNAEAAGVADRVRVVAPDHVEWAAIGQVWSNPPIRIGKPALHHLLRTWLERLSPEGFGALVVHKHLGSDSLARWLIDQGWPVTRLASRAGYRVLRVGPRTR